MNFELVYEAAKNTYKQRTPKCAAAYEEARRYLAGGECRSIAYFDPYPFTIDRADGYRYWDLDGNEYLDFLSNYTSLVHGHNHPRLVEAICDAARKGTAVPANLPEQTELAKLLTKRMKTVELVRFCNSGTEATMFAIRAAKAFTKKDAIIKMLGGYHGTHDSACISVSPSLTRPTPHGIQAPAVPDQWGVPKNVADNVLVAPYNDPEAVESILKQHADKVACILVEPFLGTTGMIPARPGYLKGLRELANRYHVLLILDEVQSFRLSTGGAQQKFGVEADLTTFGKIIGGGLSVGAFGGRSEIMQMYDQRNQEPLNQSGTFNGNRPTMAAGRVAVEMLDQPAIDRIDRLGERLQLGMEKAIACQNVPMSVTREGSLLNVHMSAEKPHDYDTAFRAQTPVSKLWYLEMVNRGIFPAKRGLFVISTAIDESVVDRAIHAFDESVCVVRPFLSK